MTVKTSFGIFHKRPRPKHWYGGLPSGDRALIKAFNQGAYAGRSDELRRSPYLPSDPKFEAWLCGYDEVAPRYVLK